MRPLPTTPASFRWLWTALALLALMPVAQAAVDIPRLTWSERSDWINVKTDVTPGAVGDGKADDTAAIQAALTMISNLGGEALASASKPRAVYLPEGTYRITKTLELHKTHGALLVGHGRSTVLQWDGDAGGRMLWQDSLMAFQCYGVSFDGRARANHGIYSASVDGGVFETAMRYEHLAFRNFKDVALFFANDNNLAAADSLIRNCLFSTCHIGICTKLSNVWTFSIEGCEFLDCGRGYKAWYGQAYVRDCHFERSSEADITASEMPASHISRCTSVGSKRFFWNAPDVYTDGGNQVIRDCQVSGWTASDGAIWVRGSQTISDCVFTNPPNANPPITVVDGRNTDNSIVVGNNTCTGELIANQCRDLRTDVIPPGKRQRTLKSAKTGFLKQTETPGGKLFDAKIEFGAKADGVTDDTAAVRACLAAAKAAGKNAVAYFPAGDYALSDTIVVSGGGYRIEGSGAWSRFRWIGGNAPSMFLVDDPQGIAVRWLNFLPTRAITDAVVHTSRTSTSSMLYDMVYLWDYGNTKDHGIRFRDMAAGSRAHGIMVSGNVRVANCSRATLLFNYTGNTLQDTLRVEGRVEGTSARDGFLGILTYEGSIEVRDNQNLVVENQYCEATDRVLTISGGGTTPGQVTIGAGAPFWTNWSYYDTLTDQARRDILVIDNYHGRIYRGGETCYNKNRNGSAIIRHTGTNPLDLISVAEKVRVDTSPNRDWEWQVGDQCRRILIGRQVNIDWVNTNLPNVIPSGGLESVAAAWDDLRQLGQLDLDWNFPQRAER
jgi:Pectate lyase superfamily protein